MSGALTMQTRFFSGLDIEPLLALAQYLALIFGIVQEPVTARRVGKSEVRHAHLVKDFGRDVADSDDLEITRVDAAAQEVRRDLPGRDRPALVINVDEAVWAHAHLTHPPMKPLDGGTIASGHSFDGRVHPDHENARQA